MSAENLHPIGNGPTLVVGSTSMRLSVREKTGSRTGFLVSYLPGLHFLLPGMPVTIEGLGTVRVRTSELKTAYATAFVVVYLAPTIEAESLDVVERNPPRGWLFYGNPKNAAL